MPETKGTMMNYVQNFITLFRNLLAAHWTSDSELYTHMSISGGKYYFSEDEVDKLYNAIANVIRASSCSASIVDTANLDIMERCPDVTNLHIDLDLTFDMAADRYDGGRYYSANQINTFVAAVENVLQDTLDHCDRKNMVCYLMERSEGYQKESMYREGIHLMFPRIILDKASRKVLYARLVKDTEVQRAIFRFGTKNAGNVLDPATISGNNGWFLFGCGKPGKKVYQVTAMYEYVYDIESEKLVYRRSTRPLPDMQLEDYMRLFSIRCDEKSITPLNETYRPKEVTVKPASSPLSKYPTEDKQKWIDLVNIVDARHADSYDDWYQYMMILHDMNPEYQEVWDVFSKRCSAKYDQAVQDQRWREYGETIVNMADTKTDAVTIGTIIYHARNENPIEYARWKTRYANAGSYESLTVRTDINLAKVISDTILCRECIYVAGASLLNGDWYRFDGVVWKLIEQNLLNQYIYNNNPATPCHTCLVEMVNHTIAKYKQKLNNHSALTAEEIKYLENEYAEHVALCKKLQDSTFQGKIINAMKTYNYVSYGKFAAEFNTNPNIIVFKNGIYELNTRRFRLATIDDKNTIQLSVNYIPLNQLEQDPEYSKKKAILDNFFETTFIDVRIRQYVLTIIAGMFHGANKWNHLYIWTGSGSNGKSVLLQLLYAVFGEYATTVSVSMFTQKRGKSSEASSDIMSTMSRRLITMQEPDEDDKFHTGLIKEMTGNDMISARDLFKSQVTFQPMFKVVCCCNTLPRIDNVEDGGIWRRIRVIPFETKFLGEEDYQLHKDEPKVKLMDSTISDKLKGCAEIFANILLQKYFSSYYDVEPVEPEPVQLAIRNYRRCADVVSEFIDECIDVTDDDDNSISCVELWDIFRSWHERFKGGKYTKSNTDFYASFTQKLRGKSMRTRTHFSNIRINMEYQM